TVALGPRARRDRRRRAHDLRARGLEQHQGQAAGAAVVAGRPEGDVEDETVDEIVRAFVARAPEIPGQTGHTRERGQRDVVADAGREARLVTEAGRRPVDDAPRG